MVIPSMMLFMQAYGFNPSMNDDEIVTELFKLYQQKKEGIEAIKATKGNKSK